jgi:alcohol dehydrogenase (cytochrome c)
MEPSPKGGGCALARRRIDWYSTSFNPTTGLYYVQTNDKCGIFTRRRWSGKRARVHEGRSAGATSRRSDPARD